MKRSDWIIAHFLGVGYVRSSQYPADENIMRILHVKFAEEADGPSSDWGEAWRALVKRKISYCYRNI